MNDWRSAGLFQTKPETSETPGQGVWDLPGLAGLQADAEGGDPEICVAVLDGPVDLSHPCFSQARIEEVEPSGEPSGGSSEHGTHVASVLFGQPGSEVRGIAPSCRGLVLPVYRQDSGGALIPCRQMDLARAINQAVGLGAHVVNVSGGELTRGGEADAFLAEAIRSCAKSDVLVVAATGNEGCECLHVPAVLPAVLAVGAADRQGRPLAFSNWGGPLSSQGVLAPGENVLGAVPGGGTRALHGTSFATPVVSAVVALLLALQRRFGKQPDPRAVREALLRSALPCDLAPGEECGRFLAGRLHIAGARRLLGLLGPVPSRSRGVHRAPLTSTPAESGHAGAVPAAVHPFNRRLEKERDMGQETRGNVGPAADPPAPGVAPASAEPEGVSPSCACQEGGASPSGVEPTGWEDLQIKLPDAVEPSGVAPSCGPSPAPAADRGVQPSHRTFCGRSSHHVFALGELGYDFGCEARLDYFVQQLGEESNAFDPVKMASHLDEKGGGHQEDANALIWTLNIDATPVYAIEPTDQFAVISYLYLARFLVEQEKEGVERISVAGQLNGTRRLYNGTVVPVINPVTRGLFNWNTERLVDAVLGAKPKGADDAASYDKQANGIRQFLHRIYYELRNLGVTPQERAKNFAATNAFQLKEVFHDAVGEDLQLDQIDVERSPICRPESDCWDVKLTFFDPTKRLEKARKVYRYTVDVSDVVPVTVGKLRTWYVY